MRILFVLKFRKNLDENDGITAMSSGLTAAAQFNADMLNSMGHITKVVNVIDANFIDHEMSIFKPDLVLIEAYWTTPEKFDELLPLYPKCIFVIRNHSKMDFCSSDGISIDWSMRYVDRSRVILASNNLQSQKDFQDLFSYKKGFTNKIAKQKSVYLPDVYTNPIQKHKTKTIPHDVINVGCFGAIRILKSNLIQAIAAIKYAESVNKKLIFHINGTRVEGNADPIIKNIRLLFANLPQHQLIEHPWLNHDDFLSLVASMDLNLCCNYSESFSMLSADSIVKGVPIVTSDDVVFSDELSIANACDADHIVLKIKKVLFWRWLNNLLFDFQQYKLYLHNQESKKIWKEFLRSIDPNPSILTKIINFFNGFDNSIVTNSNVIKNDTTNIFSKIKNFFSKIFSFGKSIDNDIVSHKTFFENIGNFFLNVVKSIFNFIGKMFNHSK